MSEQINTLIQMITLYTTQLESYDQLCSTISMSTITTIGVLFGITFTLFQVLQRDILRENDKRNVNIRRAISIILLSIPSVITLFMYIFSMYCRRVAIFRGYLYYLEENLNGLLKLASINSANEIDSEVLLFDNYLVNAYINGQGGERFLTNQIGPFYMTVFLLIIFVACFALAFIFVKDEMKNRNLFCIVYGMLYSGVLIFSVSFCVICVHDLKVNASVMQSVYEYCKMYGMSVIP